MYPLDDTICAVASPPGGAARGIVRLSGPRVREILGACFRPAGRAAGWHALARVGMKPHAPHGDASDAMPPLVRAEAVAGSLHLAGMASPLPCDVYLWPQRRSYTGQAVAEIHTLGSPPLLQAVLHGLCAAGARVAQPGEFTLRAFLAGRIDLTQAEAVLGVIDAADPGQLGVALAQLAGGLSGPLERLRDGLVDLLAHLEAGFDFAEEDLPFITAEELTAQLGEAAEGVAQLCRQMSSRGEAAPTVRAVLVGWPNVGKSSLFNALTRPPIDRASEMPHQWDGALVSEHPGTTRDYLTAELGLGGVKCQLIDTAGMGPEPDGPDNAAVATRSIEQAARAVSSQQSRRADVRILCLESTRPPNDWERSQLQQTAGGPHVVVLTKIDLGSPALVEDVCAAGGCPGSSVSEPPEDQAAVGGHVMRTYPPPHEGSPTNAPRRCPSTPATPPHNRKLPDVHLGRVLPTSSLTGEGIDGLREELRDAVLTAGACGAKVVAGTAVRCRESLRLAGESLQRAQRIVRGGNDEELVAAEVRVALDELGQVAGIVYTDDVLDRIFSRFCIGK